MKAKDITGQKFGHLTAVTYVKTIQSGKLPRHVWLFKCDCGNEVLYRKDCVMHHSIVTCGCRIKSPPQNQPEHRAQLPASHPLKSLFAPPPERIKQDASRHIQERHPRGRSFSSSHLPRATSSTGLLET